ncbi:MAG: saccharopine dehydrogenase C-terminal domain-containing protein [Bacteroidia bacterium]
MKRILILGAGRSATDFIQYIFDQSAEHNWYITLGDYNLPLAQSKIEDPERGKAIQFDVHDEARLEELIKEADAVASFMPPPFHPPIAQLCLKHHAHMITASYVSDEIKALHEEAEAAGLLFLNEMGADPGLDHMSAMRTIDKIHAKGGTIISFRSYAGALVTARSNDNPWGYKFTWAPKNVICAGQGGAARYIRDGQLRYIPYHRLFGIVDDVKVGGEYGTLEAYANRDSLPYRSKYGLENIPTLIRGTLRVPGFCATWLILVQIGLTEDNYRIPHSNTLSYADWMRSYLPAKSHPDLRQAVADFAGLTVDSPEIGRLEWAGLFSDDIIECDNASPAEILLDLFLKKWKFEEKDTDIFILSDLFQYELDGKRYRYSSTLSAEGLDHQHTAISRTVGLPAGIGLKLLLTGKLKRRGVRIPVTADLYEPILNELSTLGISFEESIEELD